MKGVKRDDVGNVILPDGMVFVKEHPSVNKKGLTPKNVVVVEHYRKKQKKRVHESFFPGTMRTIRRWWLKWLT